MNRRYDMFKSKPVFNFLITVLSIILLFCGALWLRSLNQKDDWKKETSPLPSKTVTDLCKSFNIREDDSLCVGEGNVYALDFFSIVRTSLRPEDEFGSKGYEPLSYDDVENMLGAYKYECEPPTIQINPDLIYFRCLYDLHRVAFHCILSTPLG